MGIGVTAYQAALTANLYQIMFNAAKSAYETTTGSYAKVGTSSAVCVAQDKAAALKFATAFASSCSASLASAICNTIKQQLITVTIKPGAILTAGTMAAQSSVSGLIDPTSFMIM